MSLRPSSRSAGTSASSHTRGRGGWAGQRLTRATAPRRGSGRGRFSALPHQHTCAAVTPAVPSRAGCLARATGDSGEKASGRLGPVTHSWLPHATASSGRRHENTAGRRLSMAWQGLRCRGTMRRVRKLRAGWCVGVQEAARTGAGTSDTCGCRARFDAHTRWLPPHTLRRWCGNGHRGTSVPHEHVSQPRTFSCGDGAAWLQRRLALVVNHAPRTPGLAGKPLPRRDQRVFECRCTGQTRCP